MIVVLGDIAVDVVSHLRTPLRRGSDAPASVRVMPGGSGANVAAWLGRLGARVTFVGRVGNDAFGRWLADDLRAEGVTPALVVDPERRTGVIQVLVEPGGERTMVPDRGANAVWQTGEAPEALIAAASVLHVVGYVLLDKASRPGALRAIEIARHHGVPISLDPSSHGPLLDAGPEALMTVIGRLDLLLPNRAEALALTGLDDPEQSIERLRTFADAVALKLDSDGCAAFDGERSCRVPAPQLPIVNATGAGDAFAAAFLSVWRPGGDLTTACQAGVALGSFAATLPSTR